MDIIISPAKREKFLGDLFGLFFEDLNHAADGGLYAELVQNRDFEFDAIDHPSYHYLTGWELTGEVRVELCEKDPPFPHNPHYITVNANQGEGLINDGYGAGIVVEAGQGYRLVMWARCVTPMEVKVSLAGDDCTVSLTSTWQKHERVMYPSETSKGTQLRITAAQSGTFCLAFVSLMPLDTWKGRSNGMRKDIAQALYDMKPKFLRFPGGCLTHDGQLNPDARDGVYHWKRTLGPVENRPARRNNWGYHQTMGLGFYEYFLFCEDIGCEPLPVINGGVDPHHRRFAEGMLLEQYIQDAVDLIEFAKGDAKTPWGSVRAQMGHPMPFPLHYLAIGNEEIHEQFHQNMERFSAAIRAKDPSIRIIGSAGPVVHGKPHEMGWAYARGQQLDYVDEHYYQSPAWFLTHWDHYDSFPADGPKVFLGEYASWSNTMESALAEAAYMTGLQRAPAVGLACYAPLLCHADYINWNPNMLWFDGYRIVKTPNYHVQSMFMRHQGDWSVPVEATGNALSAPLLKTIAGKIRILSDDTAVRLSHISLASGGKKRIFPDCSLSADGQLSLGEIAGDFSLRFCLERTDGQKGVLVRFGETDDQNYHQWTVGGWQNSDSGIDTRENGWGSCLTQSNLSLQSNRTYYLTLTVRGLEISTAVDGQEMNRITERPLQYKPLYLAASVESNTGDVILKAVNVQKQDVSANISVPCCACTEEVLCALPESANTLDEPEKVIPHVKLHSGLENGMRHVFHGYSVTILRFHQSVRRIP